MKTDLFAAGYRRLLEAESGIPDRVPVTAQMHEFSMAWCGCSGRTFYTDADVLVDGIVKAAADFEFDVPCLGYDVYNIELEALGQRIEFFDSAAPSVVPGATLIQEVKDLARLSLPEPGVTARMPFVLAVQKAFEQRTGAVPTIEFCAPFTLACLVRGYENLIRDIYENTGFVHDLLKVLTEQVIAPWIGAQKQALPRAVLAVGADALCSPPMTSRQIIEQFAVPYILRLRELCPVQVAVVNWWGDSRVGGLEEFLRLKRSVGAGVIRAQDPDVASLGVEVFKDFAVKNDLFLELGVGDGIVNRGPIEAIRRRIEDYVRRGAPGGRCSLYLASLDGVTPPQHVRAALAAVREYGRY